MMWVPLVIIFTLAAFWLWMFNVMLNNYKLPQCFISFTRGRDPRLDWTFAFIILNIFTAIYYFFSEYRQK